MLSITLPTFFLTKNNLIANFDKNASCRYFKWSLNDLTQNGFTHCLPQMVDDAVVRMRTASLPPSISLCLKSIKLSVNSRFS